MGDGLFLMAAACPCPALHFPAESLKPNPSMPSHLPPLDIPGLLRRHRLNPEKGLGQNFLVDVSALQRVADAAGMEPDDTVLEIGPGLGSLTRILASQVQEVIAVELDGDLLAPLGEVLAPFSNIRLIHNDILKVNPADLFPPNRRTTTGYSGTGYLVVANIPYYITSALLRHLLESEARPRRIVLTVQREVAERICAAPGDLSLLALSVQVYGAPRITAHIPAGAFYPAPKVDSAVIRVDMYPEPRIPPASLPAFFRLIKAGFSQKRKTLRNALSAGLPLPAKEAELLLLAAGIDPMRRAETIHLEEWGNLIQKWVENPSIR